MPAGSRAQQRAEAKYNITTDFPRYDLHFGAASGDLGLVEFALSHGQPVNSVLNGVLPLHAACAGGNEVVVNYLIDEGADVNAPRVPRRYSNDRHNRSTTLAVGASGSTPLHFAAANGHLSIVRILLAHGAIPSRADKHGVTPAMLARENGWIECADALDSAADQKELCHDVDYELEGSDEGHTSRAHDALEAVQHVFQSVSGAGARKLHVKRSIDNAFHLFKHNHHSHSHSPHAQHHAQKRNERELSPVGGGKHIHHHSSHQQLRSSTMPVASSDPPSPVSVRPLGNYTFYPVNNAVTSNAVNEQRRPSLPHIFGGSSSGIVPAGAASSHVFGGKIGKNSGKRRPRSAGTGAEQQQHRKENYVVGSTEGAGNITSNPGTSTAHAPPRRLGSKISLLHLFKRANGSGSGDASGNASSIEENSQVTAQNGVIPSPSASPVSIVRPKISTSAALASSSVLSTSPSSPSPSPSPSSRLPTAVDLHHQISRERLDRARLRAHTSGSSVFEEDEEDKVHASRTSRQFSISTSSSMVTGPVRPSILRTHNRSSSSHSSGDMSHLPHGSAPSTARTLRFDSSASPSPAGSIYPSPATSSTHVPSYGNRKVSTGSKLRSSRSANSIGSRDSLRIGGLEDAPEAYDRASDVPESAPPKVLSFHEPRGLPPGRARGPSFASSTSGSSPGVQSPGEQGFSGSITYSRSGYPFSISSPPLQQIDLSQDSVRMDDAVEVTDHDQEKIGRGRGLSISSAETDVSQNLDEELSNNSSTTSAQGSMAYSSISGKVAIPVYGPRDVTLGEASPSSSCEDLGAPVAASQSILRAMVSPNRTPFEPLDLRSISNYAEARDLAQLAEQEILRTASLSEGDPEIASGASLSAQLAAYGEILALEKRFKQGERQRVTWGPRSDSEEEGEEEVSDRPSRSAGFIGHHAPKISRIPLSAPIRERAGAEDKKGMARSVSASQTVDASNSAPSQATGYRRPSHGAREPKVRRPRTAESAPKGEWGNADSGSLTPVISTDDAPAYRNKLAHPRSASITLRLNGDAIDTLSSDIKIIETVPTPVDSPRTPDIVPPAAAVRRSLDSSRPATPITYDRDNSAKHMHFDNEISRFGAPLTRVATAPSKEKHGYDLHHNEDFSIRQSANANKLARMGFTPENAIHPQILNYASARSPTKARFGGIKSLVQTLKGR